MFNSLLIKSDGYPSIGLQFSIHRSNEIERNKLIPFKNKLTLREIRDYGLTWFNTTGRQVYLNYVITEDNTSEVELNRLMDLFPPEPFSFTFSVICASDETMKEACFRDYPQLNKIESKFRENGYNVRLFDPAGQDDIGGGCGQLFGTQEFMKQFNFKKIR